MTAPDPCRLIRAMVSYKGSANPMVCRLSGKARLRATARDTMVSPAPRATMCSADSTRSTSMAAVRADSPPPGRVRQVDDGWVTPAAVGVIEDQVRGGEVGHGDRSCGVVGVDGGLDHLVAHEGVTSRPSASMGGTTSPASRSPAPTASATSTELRPTMRSRTLGWRVWKVSSSSDRSSSWRCAADRRWPPPSRGKSVSAGRDPRRRRPRSPVGRRAAVPHRAAVSTSRARSPGE
ncbi:hypothetical protein RKD25_008967 [Streptomyces sp. SAI-124]